MRQWPRLAETAYLTIIKSASTVCLWIRTGEGNALNLHNVRFSVSGLWWLDYILMVWRTLLNRKTIGFLYPASTSSSRIRPGMFFKTIENQRILPLCWSSVVIKVWETGVRFDVAAYGSRLTSRTEHNEMIYRQGSLDGSLVDGRVFFLKNLQKTWRNWSYSCSSKVTYCRFNDPPDKSDREAVQLLFIYFSYRSLEHFSPP